MNFWSRIEGYEGFMDKNKFKISDQTSQILMKNLEPKMKINEIESFIKQIKL